MKYMNNNVYKFVYICTTLSHDCIEKLSSETSFRGTGTQLMNSVYITSSGVGTMLYQFLAFFFHKFDLYAVFTINLKIDNLVGFL